ncbi:proton extrusion protein PcxA [Nostoc sp. UHCC 0702]|nr:proton extrusion protein PcxA [Nostoc sp. UHCC 0702]
MNQWFLDTPERALLEAYKAAQTIKNIEAEYFGHQKISAESGNYTDNSMSYWQGCLNQNLTIIKVRLAEFQLSRSVLNISNAALLEKLQFIDEVIDKYTFRDELDSYRNSIAISPSPEINQNQNNKRSDSLNGIKVIISQKTGVLPRSIGRTINKIKSDLTPQAEEEFVRNFQISRRRTTTAIKFLLLIIIVPLLTQQLSNQLVINPIVKSIQSENVTQIFLNSQMQEEAISELNLFQKRLRFQNLIHEHPPLSPEAIEESTKEKAIEIAEEFRHKNINAISNIFADLISLIAFGIVIANSKREIVIVKSFIDELVYGISDSAKAFLIILFTDIFVGFHSPHGWEILLEGLSEHLGIAANRSVIFMFIATFPVILNTIFKYWIFRYLSRLSPSALATLKEMDE